MLGVAYLCGLVDRMDALIRKGVDRITPEPVWADVPPVRKRCSVALTRFEALRNDKQALAAAMVNRYWDPEKHKYSGYVFIQDRDNIYSNRASAEEAALQWLDRAVKWVKE